MIRKEGSKWVLRTRDGKKILGKHDTKEGAQAQETAILLSKKKRERKKK
jgi:hypothetical protein